MHGKYCAFVTMAMGFRPAGGAKYPVAGVGQEGVCSAETGDWARMCLTRCFHSLGRQCPVL